MASITLLDEDHAPADRPGFTTELRVINKGNKPLDHWEMVAVNLIVVNLNINPKVNL